MSLDDTLKRRIAHSGPISVADYMAEALSHPEFGYYMSQEPFGRGGDFITAPETSQMFGELLGLWCAIVWQQMGSPSPVNLVELGPGRGTLMSDALRALQGVPGFKNAARVQMVETSPALRTIQHQELAGFDITKAWHDSFEAVPDGPCLIIANELFDALPIRQFVRKDNNWHEVMVAVDEEALSFKVSPLPTSPDVLGKKGQLEAAEGAVIETCPSGLALAEALGQRLKSQSGGAVIIDYGYAESALGDSLQAMKGHAYHPILETPGEADLTAHVDFAHLSGAATRGGACCHGPLTQGDFLHRLGIKERAEDLTERATPAQREEILSGMQRLIDEKQMGVLFKVLALTAPDLPPPPGF